MRDYRTEVTPKFLSPPIHISVYELPINIAHPRLIRDRIAYGQKYINNVYVRQPP